MLRHRAKYMIPHTTHIHLPKQKWRDTARCRRLNGEILYTSRDDDDDHVHFDPLLAT